MPNLEKINVFVDFGYVFVAGISFSAIEEYGGEETFINDFSHKRKLRKNSFDSLANEGDLVKDESKGYFFTGSESSRRIVTSLGVECLLKKIERIQVLE